MGIVVVTHSTAVELLDGQSANPRCLTTTSAKVRLQESLSCADEQLCLEMYAITESTEMMSHRALECFRG
jgi:hypothetical protein